MDVETEQSCPGGDTRARRDFSGLPISEIEIEIEKIALALKRGTTRRREGGTRFKMGKMDRYPEPRRAVPMNSLRPSRTSRILTPGIVLVTVGILAASSITGIVVAASIFDSASPHKSGESVAQVFVLIAVSSDTVRTWTKMLADELLGRDLNPVYYVALFRDAEE